MKTGVEIISQERERQIKTEGWSQDHDAHHTNGELAKAAACYALPNAHNIQKTDGITLFIKRQFYWPFEKSWWKPRQDDSIAQRVKELAKAGALIAAEIDRLNCCPICQRCGKYEAVTMNGDIRMCQYCSDKVDREFDDEYR